jgi:hypothetical protein
MLALLNGDLDLSASIASSADALWSVTDAAVLDRGV